MMKSLLAFALTILGVLLLLSHARQGMINIDSTPLPPFRILTEPLNEAALLEIGLRAAHNTGLVGEPTNIHTLLVPMSEWRGTMLTSTALENPSAQVFVLSVKGEIDPRYFEGRGPGSFELLSAGVEGPIPTAIPINGLTLVFDATTGTQYSLSTGFIDDLASETTEEDRAMFKALQEMDIMSMVQEGGSPPVDLSIYNTPEATLEPVPGN